MPPNTQEPPKKRRWLRYSFFLALLMIVGGLLGYWVYRAERQKAVVGWVEDNGGEVYYGCSAWITEERGVNLDCSDRPRNDYFYTVTAVKMRDRMPTDLTPLAQFDHLSALILVNTRLDGLTHLSGKRSLEILELDTVNGSDLPSLEGMTIEFLNVRHTKIRDLTQLEKVRGLRYLHLRDTGVTQQQIDDLRHALPECQVDWWPKEPPSFDRR